MKKLLLLVIILISFKNINAQSPQLKELWKLYDKKEYDKLIEKGEQFLKTDTTNIEYNFWVGKAYYRKRMIKESYPYFLKAALHEDPHSSIRARAQLYLGVYYFLVEDKVNSKNALEEGRKIKTYSSIEEANEYWYECFGYNEFYSSWSFFETEHFRFYFQDTLDIHYTKFMGDCEKAFVDINVFFNSELPKKIDYFVWSSRTDARNILKRSLSFTNMMLCYIHGGNDETEGHEIAHDISFYCDSISRYSDFIMEGTATYFDQTNFRKKRIF